MNTENQPLVSIGVPVFNGEKGLSTALDSLVEQDYTNLEIIISDNCSTDTTAEICEKYARNDPRIKYSRLEKNVGAILNFNRVFELSSGEYFMWAAHDDSRNKFFVSECVEKMELCPEAAACHIQTETFVEGEEKILYIAHLDSFEGVVGLVDRYRETIKHLPRFIFYGFFRSSMLNKTQMLSRIFSFEMAFIQELSIYGDFVQIRKTLFHYIGMKKWKTLDQEYRIVFGSGKKPRLYSAFILLFFSHWKRIGASPIPFSTKLRLWAILIEHQIRQAAIKSIVLIAGRLCPEKWKLKLGCKIYWNWMHSPNIQVCYDEMFLERVIKPSLGWWR